MANNRPLTYDSGLHGDFDSHPWLSKIPYRELGKTGMRVSLVSYGGSSLANFYGDIDKNEAIDTIQSSIKAGINYIDTSPWYGDSELIIGTALKALPRNSYYIGTKAGRNFTPGWDGRFDFSGQAILKSVEKSLQRLGLDYVDVIQVHDVEFCLDQNIILKETLPALESCRRAGKAKFIGITGYDLGCLKNIADQAHAHVDTVLSYCRYNLHDKALNDFVSYFKNKNIGLINASALAMGLLSSNGPPGWHPASDDVKRSARAAAEKAKALGSSLERASLGFSLRPPTPEIATTLVSIPTQAILQENLEIVTAPITVKDEELYEQIAEIFGNINNDWEGVDVKKYKEFLQSK